VRDYNRAWDYYAGMSAAEIEAHIRQDTVGWRPTWPMGRWPDFASRTHRAASDGPFGHRFGTAGGRGSDARANPEPALDRQALDALDLDWPLTLAQLKARYKELVKSLHPDLNGADRGAEERLKVINLAYATLRQSLVA
jgi:hypothetical protein